MSNPNAYVMLLFYSPEFPILSNMRPLDNPSEMHSISVLVFPLLLSLVAVFRKYDLARLSALLDAALLGTRFAGCGSALSGINIHGVCSSYQ